MNKNVLSIIFLLTALLFATNCINKRDSVRYKGELLASIDADVPGYFVLNAESYGYQYEILERYAEHLGVKLVIDSTQNRLPSQELFDQRNPDVIILPRQRLSVKDSTSAVPFYSTNFVVLTQKRNKTVAISSDSTLTKLFADGRKVLVSQAYTNTDNYKKLVNQVDSSLMVVSADNSFDMIQKLSDGNYDYLICEASEAQLGCSLVANVKKVYTLKEQLDMFIVIDPDQKEIFMDFNHWFGKFQKSKEIEMLNYLYFERSIVGEITSSSMRNCKPGGISVYDELVKTISREQGHDWRMISAIIYNESRFNKFIISNRGAKGLMQIMPVVAREFNVRNEDLLAPETNLMLGLKLLNKIEKSLELSPQTNYKDKMSIVLACYNAGIGHVMDARRLARKFGDNPDSWDELSKYLLDKTRFLGDEDVKFGRFSGRETLAFVDNVINKYDTYCMIAKKY